MNITEYQKNVDRSLSPQYHLEEVHPEVIRKWMEQAVQIGEQLDVLKKALFYGRIPEGLTSNPSDLVPGTGFDLSHVDQDLVHAAIGMFTEAAECVEIILKAGVTGLPVDEAHLKEEMGDTMWYQGIGFNKLGTSFEQVGEENIDKLRKRYPHKFTTEAAAERADKVA